MFETGPVREYLNSTYEPQSQMLRLGIRLLDLKDAESVAVVLG